MKLGILKKFPAHFRALFASQLSFNFFFYGLKSIFLLFILENYTLPESTAITILATFMAASYGTAILGGWIADRLLGLRLTILTGSILQTLGLSLLLIQNFDVFYVALALISLACGLLKPAISTSVGALFDDPADPKRDAAYSTFYIAMNLGSLAGPTCLGLLSQAFGQFTPAILTSIVVSALAVLYIVNKMILHQQLDVPEKRFKSPYMALAIVLAVLSLSFFILLVLFSSHHLLAGLLGIIATGSLVYFLYVMYGASPSERKSIIQIVPYIFLFTCFCALFEQEGNSILLFFDKVVDRTFFGFTLPSPFLLSLGPVFVLLFGPAVASVLEKMTVKVKEGNGLLKLSIGFWLVAVSFYVLSLSCDTPQQATLTPVVIAILIQTLGELFIVPVGFSNVSRLSPLRFRTIMMSLWLMAIAYGSYFAGFIAQFSLNTEKLPDTSANSYHDFFLSLALPPSLIAIVLMGYLVAKHFIRKQKETPSPLAAE